MKRNALIREIRAVDERLFEHQAQFYASCRQSLQTLQQLNPWWLVGAGLLAGLVSGRLGWRGISAMMVAGFRVSGLLRMVNHYLVNLGDKACPDLTESRRTTD